MSTTSKKVIYLPRLQTIADGSHIRRLRQALRLLLRRFGLRALTVEEEKIP
jgi:hypothetical protein